MSKKGRRSARVRSRRRSKASKKKKLVHRFRSGGDFHLVNPADATGVRVAGRGGRITHDGTHFWNGNERKQATQHFIWNALENLLYSPKDNATPLPEIDFTPLSDTFDWGLAVAILEIPDGINSIQNILEKSEREFDVGDTRDDKKQVYESILHNLNALFIQSLVVPEATYAWHAVERALAQDTLPRPATFVARILQTMIQLKHRRSDLTNVELYSLVAYRGVRD